MNCHGAGHGHTHVLTWIAPAPSPWQQIPAHAVSALQDVPVSQRNLVVASNDWVTAVTFTEISGSVLSTVFLSIGLAGVTVFVFTGRPLLSFLTLITVLCINVTVMGILYLWDWTLGAIEGMSITSLVGLSVDYCIHLVEGHIHARAGHRLNNAKCAPHSIYMLIGFLRSDLNCTCPQLDPCVCH